MKRFVKTIFYFFVFIFMVFHPVHLKAQSITDEAQVLYEKYQASVYQIQVVNLATGKKSSIGSGFQFTADGLIATNYHVVAQAIHSPKLYDVQYLNNDGQPQPLTMVDFDVIHDLAILKSNSKDVPHLLLGDSTLAKGEHIFSMGNPLDLGKTIREGLYNGLMEKSLYKKLLFSETLNPGMSGGPVINHDGKVIGVNVATTGSQLSFLVPVEFLKKLHQDVINNQAVPQIQWKRHIEQQLLLHQNDYVDDILSNGWEEVAIGPALVPGEIGGMFKCWGGSKEKNRELFHYEYFRCSSEDEIFLSNSLRTGKIYYEYNWMTSKGLNPIRFYNVYQGYYDYSEYYDNASAVDVTPFDCHTDFVNIDGKDTKVGFCARRYKQFPNLFDVNLSIASVDHMQQGLLIKVTILGLSQDKARTFVKRFMKGIKWPKSS